MSFFDAEGKRLLTDAVRQAELQTSGEFVIVVRPASERYRHVDLAVGLLTALAILCVFLYHPEPFDFTYLPIELAGAFAVGVVASLGLPPLKRALLSRANMTRAVRRAAREAFVDRGVHRTRRRTGVLVCVSVFERHVELVPDVGVDPDSFLGVWNGVRGALEQAVRRGDVKALASGVVALGRGLGTSLPRSPDDANELPDAAQEAT
jgi:putative membrane protein